MTMTTFLPHSAAKAQQWEIAKGHLRAMAAIDGACSTGETERPYRFERVGYAIEKFIKEFEDAGFHEGSD
jgi:hypothetical protein